MVLISTFMSCGMLNSNSYWKIIKLDVKQAQHIEDILQLGGDTIFITGWKIPADAGDIENYSPYILMSFDRGISWNEKTDFECNMIDEMFYKEGILIVRVLKYVDDPNLMLGSEIIWLKFFIIENRWEELKLPKVKRGSVVRVIDKNTYVFSEDKGYASHNYLVTRDGGRNWTEYTLPLENKRDIFEDMCTQGNKIWGINKHISLVFDENKKEYQNIISIDMSTLSIVDEIPFSTIKKDDNDNQLNTHNITNILANGETLYLLGQDRIKGMGYVWKMDINDKEIKVQDSFELTKDQSPVELFFHNNQLIVVYMDMSTFLPSYILLHKNLNENLWHKEMFPDLTYPCMSFNNGILMGITEGNKIYYKQF